VCCAAGLAVLEVLEKEQLMQNAKSVGSYMKQGLAELARQYKSIGQVRGAGFFIGVDLVKDQESREPDADFAIRLVNGLRKRFILIGASGPEGHVLKIRPPLPFSLQNAGDFLSAMEDTLREESARQ
jgi:4-aminobutyrate aminotransferase-like enzyme